jgi:hypothetical protein
MEDIITFFSDPTGYPMNHFSVSLCDEQGLILAIDKSLTSFILLHHMEALPATHQNKKPIVRALYGVGQEDIPEVLLDPSVLKVLTTSNCPSVTSICKASKDGITDIDSFNCNSTYKGLSLILIPPFIAKVLLDLPTVACDKAFIATLDAIAAFDKDQKPPSPMAAAAPISTPFVETVKEEMETEEDASTSMIMSL